MTTIPKEKDVFAFASRNYNFVTYPCLAAYSAIYTDGSEDGDWVVSAAVFGHQVYSTRLPSASSIFSAEDNAMLLALKFVPSSDPIATRLL
jgi:hypothetical protein